MPYFFATTSIQTTPPAIIATLIDWAMVRPAKTASLVRMNSTRNRIRPARTR